MSVLDVFDLNVRGSCQWTPMFLCSAVFVLKASGACHWTPVLLRFVGIYNDTIQWGLMQQQSWRYIRSCDNILSHDLVLLDTERLDSKGDYQDGAKAEASVIIILNNIFNYIFKYTFDPSSCALDRYLLQR
jgi:hypothetical protein